MARTFKVIGKRIGAALLLLLILSSLFLWLWEPFTATAGTPPPTRQWNVEIIRDDFGVPHIYGKTDADTAYGVGYAHSEDDFSTLEEVIAMTRGRLGAIRGEKGAQIDYVAQLLDVQGTVDRHYTKVPADVRAVLDGYAAGLNRYADTHPGEVRLKNLFPVNGRDVAFGFALRSPFFFGLNDPIAALVSGEPLPIEGGPALDGNKLSSSPRRRGPVAATSDLAATGPRLRGGDGKSFSPLGSETNMNGSNAFAVAPARSTDNVTRLISNSHQPWRGDVAWYELVVHSEQGWDFAGANFPGSPFPLLGHNKNLGWTNTVNRPDLIDIYKLVLDDTGTRYKLDGKWEKLQQKRVWLRVKMGPFVIPYPQTVYRSVQGPVIKNKTGAYALRYAGIDDIKMLEQYFRLNKAQDFAAWQSAMAIQGVPATNFIYADAAGNIGLFYNALFPDRPAGYDWRHVLPGDTSSNIWSKSIAWSDVPRNVNPGSGYIINANNTPFVSAGPGDEIDPASVSSLLGVELDMTNRAQRAIEQFEALGQISRDQLSTIKYDTRYSKASYARQWLGALVSFDSKGDKQLAAGQALLRQWDWNLDGKGKGDALALTLMRPGMRQSYRRLAPPDPEEEMQMAVTHLQKFFGTLDPKLGDVLRLRQGKVDLPLDGGSDTLRATTLWDVDPKDGRYAVRHGDSFLMFVEWDAAGNVSSRSVQPFGSATTRPNSPHYADQAPLFVKHLTKPVYFTRQQLQGHIERQYRP